MRWRAASPVPYAPPRSACRIAVPEQPENCGVLVLDERSAARAWCVSPSTAHGHWDASLNFTGGLSEKSPPINTQRAAVTELPEQLHGGRA